MLRLPTLTLLLPALLPHGVASQLRRPLLLLLLLLLLRLLAWRPSPRPLLQQCLQLGILIQEALLLSGGLPPAEAAASNPAGCTSRRDRACRRRRQRGGGPCRCPAISLLLHMLLLLVLQVQEGTGSPVSRQRHLLML